MAAGGGSNSWSERSTRMADLAWAVLLVVVFLVLATAVRGLERL
jgi:hypothetical protein